MEDNVPEEALLSGNLEHMTPDKAVKAVRELCSQLGEDADSFHGNIWPGNIRFDWDGRAVLGSPSGDPVTKRLPEQAEYLAPEFLWDGSGSAASDVYSLALLLYCAQTGGKLPFQTDTTELDRAEALRRRMKGEAVPALPDASPLLASVVGKALSFDPEERYISPAEFLAALNETDEALPAPTPEESSVYAAIAADKEPDTREDADTPVLPSPEETADTAPPVDTPLPEIAAVPAIDTPEEPVVISSEKIAEPPSVPDEAEAASALPPTEEDRKPIPQYFVEKDFEKRGRRKSDRLPSSIKKASGKKSPLLPLLCLLAVLVIAAVFYFFLLGNMLPGRGAEKEIVSEPYVIEITPNPTAVPTAEAVPEEITTPAADTAATGEIPVAEETPSAEAPAAENFLTVTVEANVRSGPGTGYDVLEIAPVGKTYTLLGKADVWYRVDVNGTTGYINRNLVAVTETAGTEETIPLTVLSDVNIRLGAGTSYEVLGIAKAGSELTALGPAENGWYPITYGESGLYAYVAAALVTEK